MTLQRGDALENPITGERGVVRYGATESGGTLLVADLFVRPGGAVAAEHSHPYHDEAFTIVRGTVGMRLDGHESIAVPGQRVEIMRGSRHDWWNAGEEEAHVLVEISPRAARFEQVIRNMWGLAQDGKTDDKGMPSLLQMVAIGREFDDVIRFAKPPRLVQKLLGGLLAPIAGARGYIGNDPKYLQRPPQRGEPAGPWPLDAVGQLVATGGRGTR
jgi:quercetin dioxygenase-like cupin family protein